MLKSAVNEQSLYMRAGLCPQLSVAAAVLDGVSLVLFTCKLLFYNSILICISQDQIKDVVTLLCLHKYAMLWLAEGKLPSTHWV